MARPKTAQGKVRHASSASADVLFEIGTEDLPAAYLPGLIEQLRIEAAALFRAQAIAVSDIRSFGTPRRLVLVIRQVAGVQRKPAEEVRGPSKRASYDAQGRATQALLGFLRSQGGTLDDTKIVSSDKGEYLYLTKRPTATPTVEVLPTLLPQLIAKLRAPKTMRWDASGVRFARPIRWLLALYGTAPIRCSYGTLSSAPRTWTGLPKHPHSATVRSLAQYQQALKKAGVILDQAKRRVWIEREVARIAARSHGRAAPEMVSHGLLDEVTFLVEQPVSLVGQFDRKYLALPRELLLASMAKYQRVFAIETAPGSDDGSATSGAMLPTCVAILDGPSRNTAGIRQVVERILNARLADSLMFWGDDHKRLPLEQMARRLSGVTFHEKLGSMADKTQRLCQLADPLSDAWQLSAEERAHVRRACQLAKADLVSTMVKEFPTLQGVIGKYYAKDSGEPPAVAEAIAEHYLPTGDQLPQTLLGSAAAIIDKYDTLTSYFGLGIMPTGDQDPFGLRRAAQGIVEVAWKIRRPLPLRRLFEAQADSEPFRSAAPEARVSVGQRVHRYVLERLYTFAWPAPAPSNDCIDAVLGSPCDDLIDAMDRILALQRLNRHPGLLKAAKVVERTRNILKGAALTQSAVDPSRLQEPLEQQLWDVYRSNESRLTQLTREKLYDEATTVFGDLFYEPLHQFFDRVLVNVPEPALQQNRLALMQAINTLYTERIADLSKLTILQREE